MTRKHTAAVGKRERKDKKKAAICKTRFVLRRRSMHFADYTTRFRQVWRNNQLSGGGAETGAVFTADDAVSGKIGQIGQ